jgi:phosphoglycerol transferase MdoB-like AlkP superfamily enzyme
LEWAQKEDYFKNTLFVIYGDHGLPSIHSDNVPLGMIKHHIINHHVPLLFYAPGKLEPKEDKKIASQVDIMPTIAGILGVPYKIQTLGRDLRDEKYDNKRKAFLYTWHAKPERFALIDDDFIYIKQGDREGLYQYKSDEPLKDYSQELQDIFGPMKDLAHGLLESGKYLMFHNKKLD